MLEYSWNMLECSWNKFDHWLIMCVWRQDRMRTGRRGWGGGGKVRMKRFRGREHRKGQNKLDVLVGISWSEVGISLSKLEQV